MREAARRRLLELIDPALGTLARGVAKRKGVPMPTEIAAAREILDRANLNQDVQPQGSDGPQWTWEEFELILRKRQVTVRRGQDGELPEGN